MVPITPAGDVSVVATGLTTTSDLQHGPDGRLYAVQIVRYDGLVTAP